MVYRLSTAVPGHLAASWAREEMSSLAKTWARWVCTVRNDTYRRSPIWGIGQSFDDQVSDHALGRSEAEPAGLRPLPCFASAAVDACGTQRGLGADEVAAGVQPLVAGDGLVEKRAGAVHLALAGEVSASILAGKRKLQRPRAALVSGRGGLQDLGVIFHQPSATQRRASDPGYLVACCDIRDRSRSIPGTLGITRR